MTEKKDEAPKAATASEAQASFAVPAPFCNKIILHLTPITARLTFAEISDNEGSLAVRSAVTLGIHDLLNLRDLINRMVEGQEIMPFTPEAAAKLHSNG